MTDLKTLKDFAIVLNKDHPQIKELFELLKVVDGEDKSPIIYSDTDLRREAIEWVKEFGEQSDGHCETLKEFTDESISYWIKHFFGITDEEVI